VDTNHLQAETRAEDPSAPSAAATREAGQPDATQVVLVSGPVARLTSTSPSTPRSAYEQWRAAVDARHEAIDRAWRRYESFGGAVACAARFLVEAIDAAPVQDRGEIALGWRLDHVRKLLAQEAEARARYDAAKAEPESDYPEAAPR
jgi:hypothetical protein